MKKLDAIIAAGLGLVALVLYYAGLADYAFPGESAKLLVAWRGLEPVPLNGYPLTSALAHLFGNGNAFAPVAGAVSVAAIYLLLAGFVRTITKAETLQRFARPAGCVAGLTAAVLFLVSPAVHSAATHAEPRLVVFAWLALAALLFSVRGILATLVLAAMWGLGMAESTLFTALAPLALVALTWKPRHHGSKPYVDWFLFVLLALVTALVTMALCGGIGEMIDLRYAELKDWMKAGWLFVLFFTTIPFVVACFSIRKAYNEESGWMQWLFHVAMSVASILAIATPLAPEALMADAGQLPVATSAFAALTAGYLAAYWYVLSRAKVRVNESRDDRPIAVKGRLFGLVGGSVLGAVYLFAALFNLFGFEVARGAFADRLADRILADLGTRTWFISDGTLDNHLMLRAAEKGQTLHLISLSRDLDKDYLARLSTLVKAENLGGKANADLILSLDLGVLPFVQDWFSSDPEIAEKVAIFGAPDLWLSSGLKPVPEFAFFGADEKRRADDRAWTEFRTVLEAPKGWGSFRLWKVKNPVERMRLELRRHIGMVENDRGVYLQDKGDGEAGFACYDEVLSDIDKDNLCALFNLFEMSRDPKTPAAQHRHDYEKRLKLIVEDKDRRYRLWSLANYYGYIRSPEIFIRLGFTWARSGRPGEALSQIRRAIDFIPTDRRGSLLNMMAALYASEDDRARSRETYREVLTRNAEDHDALIGMMRLELLEGNNAEAQAYLERACKAGGDDPRVQIELAMLALMKSDLKGAKDILVKITDREPDNLQAWSLRAAVTMQQSDAEKDNAAKKVLDKELEEVILPAMEKTSGDVNNYYVQTTRAFLLMRKGVEKRREARDAFVVAAKSRPDIRATQDLVLGLDISLDDPVNAERHARDVLRRDRRHPLANYVMGSLALRKNDYLTAESYLRKAAEAQKPVVLAMNDLAEVYRREKNWTEAEKYATLAIHTEPKLYVAYETLGAILLDQGKDVAKAAELIQKACELSTVDGKSEDVRMLISLARAQLLSGKKMEARITLRKVEARKGELSAFELGEYENLKNDAR